MPGVGWRIGRLALAIPLEAWWYSLAAAAERVRFEVGVYWRTLDSTLEPSNRSGVDYAMPDHRDQPEPVQSKHEKGAAASSASLSTAQGSFVVVVGPDGSGKTSIAQGVLEAREGRYFHFLPPYRAREMARRPSPQPPPPTKDPGRAFPPLGWLRLMRNAVTAWIGYLTAIRPTVARGELVVADRWLYGYVVQPRPLRYGGPEWLARVTIALLPTPDVVINLTAPVDVIHSRKNELSKEEIERELEKWQHLPTDRLVTIDTSDGLEKSVRDVLLHIPSVG